MARWVHNTTCEHKTDTQRRDISVQFCILELTPIANCQALSSVSLSNLEFWLNQQKIEIKK